MVELERSDIGVEPTGRAAPARLLDEDLLDAATPRRDRLGVAPLAAIPTFRAGTHELCPAVLAALPHDLVGLRSTAARVARRLGLQPERAQPVLDRGGAPV